MALKRKAAPGQDLMINASHINLNWSLWKRGGLGHQLKPRSNITTFPIRRSCSGRPLGQIIIAQIFSLNWLDHTSSLLDHLFPSMVMVMLLEIRKLKFAAKINSQKRIIFALDSSPHISWITNLICLIWKIVCYGVFVNVNAYVSLLFVFTDSDVIKNLSVVCMASFVTETLLFVFTVSCVNETLLAICPVSCVNETLLFVCTVSYINDTLLFVCMVSDVNAICTVSDVNETLLFVCRAATLKLKSSFPAAKGSSHFWLSTAAGWWKWF